VSSAFLAVLLTLDVAAATSAAPPPRVRGPHVRPLTEAATCLLREATARSPAVRSLVEALDRSDVIVYLTDAIDEDRHRDVVGFLAFLAAGPHIRYLVIQLRRWQEAPWERVASLAHELQHAMEVARAPEVRSEAALAALYGRIGWETRAHRFETAEARATGTLVRKELMGKRW
jgi:hypothetical protein